MTTDWNDVYLKDCLILGNGKTRPLSQGDIPVFGGNGILDYCDSYNYSGGTIIIGRVGAYCGSTYISNDKIWVSDNALSAKPIKNNDIKFLYYNLLNIGLNQFAEGSSHPLLTHSLLYSLKILLPPIPEQRAIAAVLSNLDDKIDLLRRQNATLEAMGEALFKHLFVNGVKEEGKAGTLGDICACITEKFDPGSANYSIKYIGLEHIDKKIIYLSRFGESTEINSAKFKFHSGDILFGKLRPYFHKVCFAPFDGVCSTDILVIRPKKENMFLFSLFAFYQCEVVDFATYCSNGTRMPRIDWNTLKIFELSLPDKESIYKFNQMCAPWIDKIRYNQTQIHTLENLRDTLLPKLMGGEVRVALD